MSTIHLLEPSLRKLRLTRVSAEWHALEKRALAEGWTPSRYLLTLCNEELLWRESEKLRRYKKEARLPVAKTMGEYDFSQMPELNNAQFRQLCETTDWGDAEKRPAVRCQRPGKKPSGGSDRGWRCRAGLPGPVLQCRRAAAGAA